MFFDEMAARARNARDAVVDACRRACRALAECTTRTSKPPKAAEPSRFRMCMRRSRTSVTACLRRAVDVVRERISLGCFAALFIAIGRIIRDRFLLLVDDFETSSGDVPQARLPGWMVLLAEFANRTTLHGIKYAFLPSRFLVRRIIWVVILLTNTGLFIYIMTINLQKLLGYPTNINVQVTYSDSLPFAAITICNENMYRLTAVQRMGLYDLLAVDNKPNRVDFGDVCEDEYQFYPGICRLPREFLTGAKRSSTTEVREVTRQVCLVMCSNLLDAECSGVMYNRTNRSCSIVAYTGEWLIAGSAPCDVTSGMEFYRRHRCLNQTEVLCNFEDSLCTLTNVTTEKDQWVLTSAHDQIVNTDNTLSLGSGHYVNLLLTELRPGYSARIQSLYINTTGMCVELFYWLQVNGTNTGTVMSSSMATVSVIVVNEELDETVIDSRNRGPQDWSRMFVQLPPGVNRIVIEGKRATSGMTGAAVDDVTIQSCDKFNEGRECKITRLGKAYTGIRSATAYGKPCLSWSEVSTDITSRLPDSVAEARNYCRYVLQENWPGPSCYVVQTTTAMRVPEECDIPYCACRDNTTYFRCDDGFCLSKALVCNGVADCLDGSDEIRECGDKMNFQCDFNDVFACGYKSSVTGALRWTTATSIIADGAAINPDITVIDQMMLLSSELGQRGDRVRLTSPLWTFDHPTQLSFRYIFITDDSLSQSPQPPLSLTLYELTELQVPRRQLFQTTSNQLIVNAWYPATVCIPSGRYQLQFVGTQGQPYGIDVGLDDVQAVGNCNNPPSVANHSFNCTFISDCGYSFQSSSSYFTSTQVDLKRMEQIFNSTADALCGQIFSKETGTITSPGFPNNYTENIVCNFTIRQAPTSTITINFLDFAIEPESDCLYDSLEIIDPDSGTSKIYCGYSRPPSFTSKGNVIHMVFRTDSDIGAAGFKFVYYTNITAPTDFTTILRYSRTDPATGLYKHVAQFMSPPVSVSSPSCLRIIFRATAPLAVTSRYLDETGTLVKTQLYRTLLPITNQWARVLLDLAPPPTPIDGCRSANGSGDDWTCNQSVVIVFKTDATSDATTSAMIADVALFPGICNVVVANPTLTCNFNNIDQCGYNDKSQQEIRWTRIYIILVDAYYMRVEFNDSSSSTMAVLRSPVIHISSVQCLRISYYSSSRKIFFNVAATPADATGASRIIGTSQLSIGQGQMFVNITPGTYFIDLQAYSIASEDNGKVLYAMVYEIKVDNESCTNDNDLSDNINCNFEDLFACNYNTHTTLGLQWIWAKFSQLVADDQGIETGHVMIFNGSTPTQPSYGVLATPAIAVSTGEARSLGLAVYGSTDNMSLTIYQMDGQDQMKLKLANFLLTSRRWSNVSVCLPVGVYRIAFVAYDDGQSDIHQFVAIDNVTITNTPCNNVTSSRCASSDPDLSDCLDRFYSASPVFQWTYTSDIRDDVITPAGDACIHVLYDLEGSFTYNRTHKLDTVKAECDIYIKGRNFFDVTLTFPAYESTDPSQQYIQIYYYRDGELMNQTYSGKLANSSTSMPLTLSTKEVLHLHVVSLNGLLKFNLLYYVKPASMTGYAATLRYAGAALSYATSLQRQQVYLLDPVGVWSSPPRQSVSSSVCISFDIAFAVGEFGVSLIQWRSDSPDSAPKTSVLLQSAGVNHNNNKPLEWTSVRVEAPLEGDLDVNPLTSSTWFYQFVISVSIVNSSFSDVTELFIALNNIYAVDGSCWGVANSSLVLERPCPFDRGDTCGFYDASFKSTRWTVVAERTSVVISDLCRVDPSIVQYSGKINRTVSGRTCQRWDSQYPHTHMQDNAEYFVDSSLEDAANYCRNPSNPYIPRSPWCYTTDLSQYREYCDVPYCLEYHLQAELVSSTFESAVLISPPLPRATTATSSDNKMCLSFSYLITSTVVAVKVGVVYGKTPPVADKMTVLATLGVDSELASSQPTWLTKQVLLPPRAGELPTRALFVASKVVETNDVQTVAIDNVMVTTNCTVVAPIHVVTEPRVEYTGERKSKTAYKDIVLNELAGIDMQQLTSLLAHQQSQLINKCSFSVEKCSNSSFKTEFTDLGQCYTYNFNESDIIMSNYSGTTFGAKFVFNIEQYEYTPGYSAGAGVKFQLHSQSELPIMKDLGVATAPGLHTLSSIYYLQTSNIGPPYGSCVTERELSYFPEEGYTEGKCRLQLDTSYVETSCGCKDINMPGPAPYCNLTNYLTCVKPIADSAQLTTHVEQCPSACSMSGYDIAMSASLLPADMIDDLLGDNAADIARRYYDALEVQHRVDPDLMLTTVNQLMKVIDHQRLIKDYLYFNIYDSGTSTAKRVGIAVQHFIDMVTADIVGAGRQLFNNFAKDYGSSMKPSVTYLADQLTTGYSSMAVCRDVLITLQSVDQLVNSSRRDWYGQVINTTIQRAHDVIFTVDVFRAKTTPSNADTFQTQCSNGFRQIVALMSSLLINLRPISDYLATTSGGTWPTGDVRSAIDAISHVLVALADGSECTLAYSRLLDAVTAWFDQLNLSQRNLTSAIDAERAVIRFNRDEIWLALLVSQYTGLEMTKIQLAETVLGDRMLTVQQNGDTAVNDVSEQIIAPLETLIADIEDRIVNAYMQLFAFLTELYVITGNGATVEAFARSLRIWRKPVPNLELPNTIQYGLSADQTWQVWLQDITLKDFVASSASSRLTMLVGNYFGLLAEALSQVKVESRLRQARLVASVDTLKKTMQDFIDLTRIDESFLQQNILTMNVFYGELKSESVGQSPAYVWVNYFSDMGSYFGLLMGTSILTILEIVDLGIYHTIVKIVERFQSRKKRRRDVIEIGNDVADSRAGNSSSDGGGPEDGDREKKDETELDEITVETETET